MFHLISSLQPAHHLLTLGIDKWPCVHPIEQHAPDNSNMLPHLATRTLVHPIEQHARDNSNTFNNFVLNHMGARSTKKGMRYKVPYAYLAVVEGGFERPPVACPVNRGLCALTQGRHGLGEWLLERKERIA